MSQSIGTARYREIFIPAEKHRCLRVKTPQIRSKAVIVGATDNDQRLVGSHDSHQSLVAALATLPESCPAVCAVTITRMTAESKVTCTMLSRHLVRARQAGALATATPAN